MLFGDANPCGHLPVTLPRVPGQVPIYYNESSAARPVNGYYGDKWQSYHDTLGTPAYPFGYGLSYTDFELSDIAAEPSALSPDELRAGRSFRVTARVRNTGERGGKALAQLYIRDVCASMCRPLRELKGFEKLWLDAGETREVAFSLGQDELGFWGANGRYAVEAGTFEIFVGFDAYAKRALTLTVR